MKTKTIKIKIYSFNELSNEVKEKILEEYRDINVNYSAWADVVIDEWKMKLKDLGYFNVEIYYSGFYCQGSGAYFTGKVDVNEWIKKHKAKTRFKKLLKEIEQGCFYEIRINHGYRYKMYVEYEAEGMSDKAYGQLKEVVNWIEQEAYELSEKIYKDLEREYEYLISDEAVIDTIKENNFEFLEDGSRQIYI